MLFDLLKEMRISQWYKNLVIFLALVFSNNLFNQELLIKTFLGFISLCLVSSSYYIINDIKDVRSDRKHPEKKHRPIAAGKISIFQGRLTSIFLLTISFLIAHSLSPLFSLFPIALFMSTLVYSFYLKNKAIIDIHVIAFNFLLRAVSGAVLIGAVVSPWLVVLVFLAALFLAVGKRKSDLSVLGKNVKEKPIYSIYTEKILDIFSIILVSVLLMVYSLYTFLSRPDGLLLFTLPFATFAVFRYMYFISTGHKIARKTELVFRDRQMLVAFVLWLVSSLIILYVV